MNTYWIEVKLRKPIKLKIAAKFKSLKFICYCNSDILMQTKELI